MTVSSSIEKLNHHFAQQLGCHPEDLERNGVGIVTDDREERGSGGAPLPFWAILRSDGAVVSVSSAARASTGELLEKTSFSDLLSKAYRRRLLQRLRASNQAWYYTFGVQLYCDPLTFTPRQNHPVHTLTEADLSSVEAPEGLWLHREEIRQGLVFAAMAGNRVVSYARVCALSDWGAEVTVATDAAFRRQGLGKSVVTAATREILKESRIAIYACDVHNDASLRLALSLGYRKYANDLVCIGRPSKDARRP